jgi:DNA-binding LytR/AlgR family response regulator
MKVHRSYLVNLQWVQELRQGELLTVKGHRVPVSRTAYPQVRTAIRNFCLRKRRTWRTTEEGGA